MLKINTIQTSLLNRSADIFTAGCAKEPKCEECHNPSLWDFDNGQDCKEALESLYTRAESNLIKAVRIMGGEPSDQDPCDLYAFVKEIRTNLDPEIWIFTGWELDRFLRIHEMAAALTDFIKTGPYIKGLAEAVYTFDKSVSKTGSLTLASCNQKVYRRGGTTFTEIEPLQIHMDFVLPDSMEDLISRL